jgi:hypothetical protein
MAIVFARNEHALFKGPRVVAAVGGTVCGTVVGAGVAPTTGTVVFLGSAPGVAVTASQPPSGAATPFACSSVFNVAVKLVPALGSLKVSIALSAADADTPVIVYDTEIPPARRLEVNLLVEETSVILRMMLSSGNAGNFTVDFNVVLKADW